MHEARMFRALYVGMRIRVERAREAYAEGREQGRDRIGAGLAALRAAAGRHVAPDHGRGAEQSEPTREELQERLARLTGRGDNREQEGQETPASDKNIRERIDRALGRGRWATPENQSNEQDKAEKEREAKRIDEQDSPGRGRDRSRDDGLGL